MSTQGRRKIPIPSFAPQHIKDAKSTEAETNNASQNGRPETRLIRLPVNVQCMIHLDSALQLHLHQQKRQGIPNCDRISFADFSKISSKVETGSAALLSPSDDVHLAAVTESQKKLETTFAVDLSGLWNLPKADRFWHDLYCVAVPDLYHVNDSAVHISGEKDETDSNHIPHPKKRRRLAAVALELTPRVAAGAEPANGNKNRVKELRRLVQEASTNGVPKIKSDNAFRLLLSLRRETINCVHGKKGVGKSISENASSRNSSGKTNKFSIVDSLLQEATPSSPAKNDAGINGHGLETNKISSIATTIDDRIRARAKERERNLEQARAARKDPRDDRVAIADSLYSYACHILRRRQSRSRFLGRPANKKALTTAGSKCVVTFKEVVQNGLPNRSRKDIARIMSDIVQVLSVSSNSCSDQSTSSSVVSMFLKWKNPKTGEAYGIPISKNATITIDTSDFKKVREILNRSRT